MRGSTVSCEIPGQKEMSMKKSYVCLTGCLFTRDFQLAGGPWKGSRVNEHLIPTCMEDVKT